MVSIFDVAKNVVGYIETPTELGEQLGSYKGKYDHIERRIL